MKFLFGCVLFFYFAIASGAQTILTVEISDSPDPIPVGAYVNFDVEVANVGNSDTNDSIILEVSLPMDVPVSWQEYVDADDVRRQEIVDAFEASAGLDVDDNIWDDDQSTLYVGQSFSNACESMVIQAQNLELPPGALGSLYYGVNLPSSRGLSGLAYDTASGDRIEVSYGLGGCNSEFFDDCIGIPCMGPRLTMVTATGTPIAAVDDGVEPVGDGCQDFSATFPPGHIALIDRGSCEFSVKAENATFAEAAGVIITNTEMLGSATSTPDSIMLMGCSEAVCHSSIITIPAAFLSYNAGEALKIAISQGDVTVYMGVRSEEIEYKQTRAIVWQSPYNLPYSGGMFIEKTTLVALVFTDGFETGDTSPWSMGFP